MQTRVYRTIIPSLKKEAYFTEDGEIFIPILQPKHAVRNKIRHEFGHALLYQYPKIRSLRGFVFFGHSGDPNDYVSRYAMTDPDEDFCETFLLYLRHQGKIPKKYLSTRVARKWEFIAAIRLDSF